MLQQGDELEVTREAHNVVDQRGIDTEAPHQEFHELLRYTTGAEISKELAQTLAAEREVGMGENKGTLLVPG